MVEAAGLRWLASARPQGGPRVAEVLSVEPGRLALERITTTSPTPQAAEEFGAALARMHGSLQPGTAFGALPPDHPDTPPLFGPAEQLLEVGDGKHATWGAFHAQERLALILELLGPELSPSDDRTLRAACERIASGELDQDEPAALIHGDLWSGNVLWHAQEGAVLIDPAAHAGHRESDLAMLQLFGLPHLERVLASYQEQASLAEGWEDRVPVHQLFFLAVHWLLFGPSYRRPTLAAAERALAL